MPSDNACLYQEGYSYRASHYNLGIIVLVSAQSVYDNKVSGEDPGDKL